MIGFFHWRGEFENRWQFFWASFRWGGEVWVVHRASLELDTLYSDQKWRVSHRKSGHKIPRTDRRTISEARAAALDALNERGISYVMEAIDKAMARARGGWAGY